jgi:hypothetical protein
MIPLLHHLPTLFARPDKLHDPLYVVAPVINSSRFRTRWKHYEDFAKHCAEAGAILYTVEVAFGDRDFAVTDPTNPRHIQLRTCHELWLKERAINIGVSRLPCHWKYVAWIDPDCMFHRHDWANETLHKLQHHPIVQMWSHLIDVTDHYEIHRQLRSFMDVIWHGGTCGVGKYQKFGSPGLAWACRRDAWNAFGGLIDFCILGAGDWFWANSIMGRVETAMGKRNDITAPFYQKILRYQEHLDRGQCEGRRIIGNAGLVRGTVTHYWHGPRSNRQYGTRGSILVKYGFDPDRDLLVDWQGLYQLSDRSPDLRIAIQKYFAERNEDELSK